MGAQTAHQRQKPPRQAPRERNGSLEELRWQKPPALECDVQAKHAACAKGPRRAHTGGPGTSWHLDCHRGGWVCRGAPGAAGGGLSGKGWKGHACPAPGLPGCEGLARGPQHSPHHSGAKRGGVDWRRSTHEGHVLCPGPPVPQARGWHLSLWPTKGRGWPARVPAVATMAALCSPGPTLPASPLGRAAHGAVEARVWRASWGAEWRGGCK